MMRPGVMAGWIILVTIFMREFSATLFHSPGPSLWPLLYFLYLDGMRGVSRPSARHFRDFRHPDRYRPALFALGVK
jgi:hypothetical protein